MDEQEKKSQQARQERKPAGQILKEVRQSRKISLETVQNETKIPMDATQVNVT